jgi:hypothetical protein
MVSSFLRFLDYIKTPLDERSARRKHLSLITHNTHNRHTSMPSMAFEPTISASEQPQTYALGREDTGTGHFATSEAIFYLRGLERCFNINKRDGKLRYRVFKNIVCRSRHAGCKK